MKLLSYLSCFCAVETVVLGLIILVLDRRSAVNRIAAAACLTYSLWALGMTFAYGSADPTTALAFYKFSFLGSLFVSPLMVWLYLLLADIPRASRRVLVALSFAWAGFILGDYLLNGFYYASFRDGPWGNVGVPSEHWFWATYSPYFQALQVIAAIFVWNHRASRRGLERERRQLRVLVPGLLFTIGLDFLSWALEVWAGLPNAMVLSLAVMVSVMAAVIVRYRYLLPDEPLLERHLFEVTQESGLVVDAGGRIVGANEQATRLLETEEQALIGRELRSLFADTVLLDREWGLVTKRQSLHHRLLVPLGVRTLVLTLTPRFDEFNDLAGVIVSVGDLPGFDERAAGKGISLREKQVLLLAVQDVPPTDIADALAISPGTVKSHLHNLCEKTGSANRVELFARLLQSD